MKTSWCSSIIGLIVYLTISSAEGLYGSRKTGSKVLLLLLDGVRYDYPDENPVYMGFPRMAANGVRAPYLVPVFPSRTYPNMMTLVTGLYPDGHGFVNNWMYDTYYEDIFKQGPDERALVAHWWNYAEPLWITAEKNGKRSALYWWDGCSVEIRGRKPSYCKPYQNVFINDTKKALRTILRLFEQDEIDLVQLFHKPIDTQGQVGGPDSLVRKHAFKDADFLLNWLQNEMVKRKLTDKVNIIVVSDHGMTLTDPKRSVRVVSLEPTIDTSDIKIMTSFGAMTNILPEEGKLDKLYAALSTLNGINVYKKEEIPERYHLKNHRLTLPLLLVAKLGYAISGLDISGKSLQPGRSFRMGEHGYDPMEVPEMNGIFYGRGPNFKKGILTDPLSMVDVYNVLCQSLGIPPRPNNGSRYRTDPMMVKLDIRNDFMQNFY